MFISFSCSPGLEKIVLEQDDFSDKEISKNNIQFLWVSFGQATLENVIAKDFLNTDAKIGTEVVIEKIDEFIEWY
jgi:hypothetical protein